jgi:hypothetical protein
VRNTSSANVVLPSRSAFVQDSSELVSRHRYLPWVSTYEGPGLADDTDTQIWTASIKVRAPMFLQATRRLLVSGTIVH